MTRPSDHYPRRCGCGHHAADPLDTIPLGLGRVVPLDEAFLQGRFPGSLSGDRQIFVKPRVVPADAPAAAQDENELLDGHDDSSTGSGAGTSDAPTVEADAPVRAGIGVEDATTPAPSTSDDIVSVSITLTGDRQPVRVVEIDGEPWFVGADIARILGIASASGITRMVDDEDKGSHELETPGGRQNLTIVNESGMYTALMRSNNPAAKPFRRWITSEVLPQIRKTGAYSATPELTDDQIIAQALQLTTARVEKLTARLAVVEPKAAAFDRWLSSNVHYGVAEVSQALHDLGADTGRNRLFAYMQERGWIYRDQRGDWRPYQAQIETRRLAVKLSRCENSRTGEEFAAHTVRITAKGAVALAVMLNVAPADLAEALTALDEEAAA